MKVTRERWWQRYKVCAVPIRSFVICRRATGSSNAYACLVPISKHSSPLTSPIWILPFSASCIPAYESRTTLLYWFWEPSSAHRRRTTQYISLQLLVLIQDTHYNSTSTFNAQRSTHPAHPGLQAQAYTATSSTSTQLSFFPCAFPIPPFFTSSVLQKRKRATHQ